MQDEKDNVVALHTAIDADLDAWLRAYARETKRTIRGALELAIEALQATQDTKASHARS